jgi:hypothetical protein
MAPGPNSCTRTFVPVEQPRRQLHVVERHTVVPVPECQQHGSHLASTCKCIIVMREMSLCLEHETTSSPHWSG